MDKPRVEDSAVLEHEALGSGYRRLVLRAPGVAAAVEPGQFVHVRIPGAEVLVLRRPFSVFDAGEGKLAVLYKVVGRGTALLENVPVGSALNIMGPLGRGFPRPAAGATPVLVAGGYGVAPLYFLARRISARGVLFAGGRGAADLLCLEEFAALGWTVEAATEDGSRGRKGLVTEALDAWLTGGGQALRPALYACGPDGMLRAVAQRGLALGLETWISLDRHMGCGVGACLACVQKLRDPDGRVRWGRVCREGPVFEARQVVWSDA